MNTKRHLSIDGSPGHLPMKSTKPGFMPWSVAIVNCNIYRRPLMMTKESSATWLVNTGTYMTSGTKVDGPLSVCSTGKHCGMWSNCRCCKAI
jgi:hypothetical protein